MNRKATLSITLLLSLSCLNALSAYQAAMLITRQLVRRTQISKQTWHRLTHQRRTNHTQATETSATSAQKEGIPGTLETLVRSVGKLEKRLKKRQIKSKFTFFLAGILGDEWARYFGLHTKLKKQYETAKEKARDALQAIHPQSPEPFVQPETSTDDSIQLEKDV